MPIANTSEESNLIILCQIIQTMLSLLFDVACSFSKILLDPHLYSPKGKMPDVEVVELNHKQHQFKCSIQLKNHISCLFKV